MKLNNILYMINNFNYFYTLTEKEQTILKNYDVFHFYEISIKKYEIEKFEKLLSKYLALIKLNGYNVYYNPQDYNSIFDYNYNMRDVKFNGSSIQLLYRDNILSLQDIINIKNIIENNFKTAISYNSRFYFKSYNDAKDFLIKINKKDVIKKY